jgi:HK97 family phage prohead protease
MTAIILTAADAQARLRHGHTLADVVVRKEFLTEIKRDGLPERTLRFRITTSTRDRDGDTLAANGWELAAYRRNPVVMYGHSYRDLPIGRTIEIVADSKGLTATAEFTDRDLNPFGFTCYQMAANGFLRAASVGFRPLEHTYNDVERGIDYARQELLEWSVVPIPANAEALLAASAAGIDLAPLRAYAHDILARTGAGSFAKGSGGDVVLELEDDDAVLEVAFDPTEPPDDELDAAAFCAEFTRQADVLRQRLARLDGRLD